MKTIWKFPTEFERKFTIRMPKGAEILCIQRDEKDNTPCIWAIIDSTAELQERYFELFGAGHELYSDMGIERKYIGTYQYQNGQFVGHLFERID